jgi:hypothetical protein
MSLSTSRCSSNPSVVCRTLRRLAAGRHVQAATAVIVVRQEVLTKAGDPFDYFFRSARNPRLIETVILELSAPPIRRLFAAAVGKGTRSVSAA